MGIFKYKDKKPRIAFREQRDGTRHYFVETWKCYESGCSYFQESEETTSIEKAEKMLEKITNKEIVGYGIVSTNQLQGSRNE
jgi:hypothetical protein